MRQVWLYCGTILAFGLLLAYAVEPSPVVSQTSTARVAKVVGMASCSSSGCHGASLEYRDGQDSVPLQDRRLEPATWKNAASWWVKHDPHTKAYADLSSALSAQIVARLNPETDKPKPAWERARCLACHSTPQSVYAVGTTEPDLTEPTTRLRAEGVSCDACHTQPGRATDDWQRAHTAPQYRAESYEKLGMRSINTLADRATMCAGCHVGAPADPKAGIPARNMNHDMIAAGHPRLNWDYATYSDALPPHWQEYDRSDRTTKTGGRGNDWDLRTWLEGEVYSTAAALELTADRSGGPAANDPARPWPELAESNCFACHHSLVPESWRRRENGGYDAMKVRFPDIKPGSNLWLSTAYSLPLQKLTAKDADLTAKYKAFFALMSSRYPNPAKVRTQAAELRTALLRWATTEGPKIGEKALREALDAASGEKYLPWDECVQIYNATRPVLLMRAADGSKPTASIARWKQLGGLLELPRQAGENWNSPRMRRLEGDGIENEFDKEFETGKDVRESMKALFDGLKAK